MAISEKDILQILAWLEKSDWQELHLESGTFKLTVSKTGRPGVRPPEQTAPEHAPAATRSEARPAPKPAAPPPAPRPAPPPKPAVAEAVDPSWIPVKSPTLGNFYVAPQPGAPPFVTLGKNVGPDDTVAIVEVMKLMNHVKAEASGKIARICAQNGDLVEFEQVLFLIDPVGADA
jgi:acetyl-CoA carboxylase biotin carboxyl carrier protein